jgi:hypothetical protein
VLGLDANEYKRASRQIGQLFMVGFEGTVANDHITTLIQDHHVGSVLLTAQNLKCAFKRISRRYRF